MGDSTTQIAVQEDSTQDDAPIVSRKRRNNNKIVSPRKPLRQTTLNRQGQRQPLEISPEDALAIAKRPRKSLRKSLRRSMLFVADTETDPQSGVSKALPILDSATELASAETTSFTTLSPFKLSPSKKNRLRKSTRSRSSVGEPFRLSGAFFADAPIDFSETSSEVVTFGTENIGTPVRSSTMTEVPKTAPAKIRPSRSELEQEMVNFFTPVPRLKKLKRRSSPIKSYLQELLEKKSSLEITEQEADEHWTMGEEKSSDEAGIDVEMIQEPAVENTVMGPPSSMSESSEIKSDKENLSSGQDEEVSSETEAEAQIRAESQAASEMSATTSSSPKMTAPVQEEQDAPMVDVADVPEESPSAAKSAEPVYEHVEEPSSDNTSESSESADSNESTESTSSTSAATYDNDDTIMLRSFLTRVQASKAKRASPKRKRSLPHSPLRIPLGDVDNNLSPSPVKASKEEADRTASSPMKRSKRLNPDLARADETPEPASCRRSGRTRLPVKSGAPPPGAPSFIPVRRLGQDADVTVTLKGGRSEEKELAALTRVNTRKNKAGALSALEVLTRKGEEREDPVLRQRLLKEVFEEKEKRKGGKKGTGKKSVVWAEELARVREFDERKIVGKGKVGEKKGRKEKTENEDEEKGEKDKEKPTQKLRVGTASNRTRESKIALGMGVNGTPAPKRRLREPRMKA